MSTDLFQRLTRGGVREITVTKKSVMSGLGDYFIVVRTETDKKSTLCGKIMDIFSLSDNRVEEGPMQDITEMGSWKCRNNNSGTETGLIMGSKLCWGFTCCQTLCLAFYMLFFFFFFLWMGKKTHPGYIMVLEEKDL